MNPSTKLREALEAARDTMQQISETRFGWDGDCGVMRKADEAIEAIDAALTADASDQAPAIPACRMQGGICACRSGGSFGGCAIERGYTTPFPERPTAARPAPVDEAPAADLERIKIDLAHPVGEKRRVRVLSQELIDGELVLCINIEDAPDRAPSTDSATAPDYRDLYEKCKREKAAAYARLAEYEDVKLVHPVTAADSATERECKCSFRGKILGDGCDVCNPEMAAQIAEDNRRDDEEELATERAAARLAHIERKHVMGASYGGITSLNVIVHGDDYAAGGALYAIDCMIDREAGRAIAAMKGES